MSTPETPEKRLEKLEGRLEEIADALDAGEITRAEAVDDVVIALRRYGVADGFYAKHDRIEEAGTKFISRTIAGEPCAAVFRPDEPAEFPAQIDASASPVRDDEFATLLREAAEDLRTLERAEEEILASLIMLVANEPACIFQDHIQARGKVYFRSRLRGLLGTTLVQAGEFE